MNKKLLIFLFCVCLVSCNQDNKQTAASEFSLLLLLKDNSQALLLSDHLDSVGSNTATLNIPKTLNFHREFIVKDGFYYQVNYKNNYFRKFSITEKGLVAIDSILIEKNYLESAIWVNNSDTLLLSTIDASQQDIGNLFVIDTKNFSLLSKKTLPIPPVKGEFNILNIGVMNLQDNKLWLAYSYSKYIELDDYTTSDSMYFMTLEWPTLAILHQQKDSRSTYPGGLNFIQSYSFTDENGDLYFMSCPGIALGNNDSKPTALFRKNKNSLAVDSSYMIDISDRIGNHAYGMWYIGKQEAIIRSERKDLYSTFSTHHSTYQFEYYIVNLKTGTLTKINVPLDKGTRKENVWVKENKVYIAIDDDKDQHAIWIYDKQTQNVQKGLTVPNNTNFILRLDHIKPQSDKI